MDRIREAISMLSESVSRDQAPPTPELDSRLRDTWNIYDRLRDDQSYYFFGSKGSGKTTIIGVRRNTILSENKDTDQKTLPCVLNCSNLFISREKSLIQHSRNKIAQKIFGALARQLYPFLKVENYYWISSIYVWLRKLSYNFLWDRKVNPLQDTKPTSNVDQGEMKTSRFRLGLTTDIASIGFSLIDAGFVSIGNVKFTPISIDLKQEKEQQIKTPSRAKVTSEEEKIEEAVVQSLVIDIGNVCKKLSINKIVFFVDDLHDLPLQSQVRLVNILMNLKAQFYPGIEVVIKLFSATDLSSDIGEALGLDKEWEVINIQSSLEGIDAKTSSLEMFLEQILVQKFTKSEAHELFPRSLVEQITVLSGGHPRRFIRICERLLEKTQGRIDHNLFDFLMLSSSEIINESRRSLIIQLGIENDAHAEDYQFWYENTISNLVDYISSKGNNQAIFLIPQSKLRNKRSLEQWIKDAIVIGDILDISKDLKNNKSEFFRLLALNPATIYDKKNTVKFSLYHQDVLNLQTGAKRNIRKNDQILDIIAKG